MSYIKLNHSRENELQLSRKGVWDSKGTINGVDSWQEKKVFDSHKDMRTNNHIWIEL